MLVVPSLRIRDVCACSSDVFAGIVVGLALAGRRQRLGTHVVHARAEVAPPAFASELRTREGSRTRCSSNSLPSWDIGLSLRNAARATRALNVVVWVRRVDFLFMKKSFLSERSLPGFMPGVPLIARSGLGYHF